jgi:D-3-phosphoglycerate dehydrogenase
MKAQNKVLVTWRLMIDYIKKNKILKKYPHIKFDLYSKKQSLNEKQILKKILPYEGLICGDDEINKKVLDYAKKLKVISKWGTGIDSIDKNYCKVKKIKLFNTPGAFTNSVVQLAMSLMFAASRDIVNTDSQIRRGVWPKTTGTLIKGKVLGIVGLGKIGKLLAKLCHQIGMKIIYYDIKKNHPTNKNFKKLNKQSLLRKSDYIVICCDLNNSSKNLISLKDFKIMKKSAAIINVARGPIINEKDLIKALKKKFISFAGLDVFLNEPIRKNHELVKMKNCILSSHNAFNCIEEVNFVNKNTLNNLIKNL